MENKKGLNKIEKPGIALRAAMALERAQPKIAQGFAGLAYLAGAWYALKGEVPYAIDQIANNNPEGITLLDIAQFYAGLTAAGIGAIVTVDAFRGRSSETNESQR